MLKLTGKSLVKFLYQHQNTRAFDHIKYKIKNHYQHNKFSIDEIYVFLLLYAPEQILKENHNGLKKIYKDILSKAPKLTHKNFQIPAHIPFLDLEKHTFKKCTKPFLMILDELGYYSAQIGHLKQLYYSYHGPLTTMIPNPKLFRSNPLSKVNYNEDYANLILKNTNIKLFNFNVSKTKIHYFLKGISKLIQKHKSYYSLSCPTILNFIVPYSHIFLRVNNSNFYNKFSNIKKCNMFLNRTVFVNDESILHLASLNQSYPLVRKYVLNILSKSLTNCIFHLIKTPDESIDVLNRLSKTLITPKIQEKDFLDPLFNEQNDSLNPFEIIYMNGPKQSIIHTNVDLLEHYKNLSCLDFFVNAKNLTDLQSNIDSNFSLGNSHHAFGILNSSHIFNQYFENELTIFEVLSSYPKKYTLELLLDKRIQQSVKSFFRNIDKYLMTDSKDFLLLELIETCIEQQIWKPTYEQLLIFQKHLLSLMEQENKFMMNDETLIKEKLYMVDTLLFDLDLSSNIPYHETTKDTLLIKY